MSNRSDQAARRHTQQTHDQHRKTSLSRLSKSALTSTKDIEAVSDGILSVETTHWHGALNKGPHYDLFPAGQPDFKSSIAKTEAGTTITAGSIAATVTSEPHTFDIQFHGHGDNGTQKLTSLLSRSVGFAY